MYWLTTANTNISNGKQSGYFTDSEMKNIKGMWKWYIIMVFFFDYSQGVLKFYSLKGTTVATNTCVFQCYVVFVILASIVFLGEKVSLR